MVATLANNPYSTTTGFGLFQDASTQGLVQGTAYPDPATRFQLRRGWLSNNETIPMWGGVGIYEDIPGVTGTPPNTPLTELGVQVGRATANTGTYALAGFSVFDQAYAMVNSPSSPVPLAGSYMQVNSYRLGSGARIAVACDPALVDLYGLKISSQVSWDYVNQLLVPYIGTLTISSGTYVSATGVITLTMSASIGFSPGDSCVISSLTGTGAYASLNGTWTAISPTSGTTVTLQGPVGEGAATITGGSLTLGSGSDVALACSVLEVKSSNCMTVNYNSTTNTASWNTNGSCAVIQI